MVIWAFLFIFYQLRRNENDMLCVKSAGGTIEEC